VLDRDSGEIVWERVLSSVPSTRKTGGVIAPAAYAGDRIFVASNTSGSASRVWALDAHTGAVLWQSRTLDSASFGGLAIANGVLFAGGSGFRVGMPASGIGVGSPGELVAFDAVDGSELISHELRAGRGGGFSIAQGRVLVGSGFTFFASNDEPLVGALEVFEVP
jgi:outer membrane protein assembly factor BamB